MARHVVATLDEIAPGTCKIVTVAGREIGIFNVASQFYGLINRCPHGGAPLCRGRIHGRMEAAAPGQYRLTRPGEMLRCPWHGWEFDIRTGQSWCDPDNVRVRSYAVSVEPGETLAKGPFVADTVSVTVDQHYIVVDL
ncbi:MAG: Rieske (2Fe-2S) protein [Alphaproteobacteria bacterium]|nr:Rieske (2Fe-2S) protein [Alphaproteobacteria bacterium]